MKDFLTSTQIETLKAEGYDVSGKGFYINLYRDEFDSDVWEQICSQANVNWDIDKLTILSFGTIINK